MYLDQKIRIPSPLLDSEIKRIADSLSIILGDSILLTNIALLHSQGLTYTSDESIRLTAVSFADSVPPDMLKQYKLTCGLGGDELRNQIARQVYSFINESSKFFRNSRLLAPLFQELKTKNLYITTDRVSDDVFPPYIDVKICRG